jgi:hypothetical protein
LDFLGLKFRILLRIRYLDPVLRLFAGMILLRPLFRASTVARSHQLHCRRY